MNDSILTSEHHAYNDEANDSKNKAHRSTAALMRKLAAALDMSPSSYEIRSNKGGIAVSGEVTLHHERIYIQAGSMMGLLVRSCKGRKDYTGGRNNWFKPGELNNPEQLAAKVRVFMERYV